MTDLFTPMDLHDLHLPNRIWMSAMTRTRASDDNVPTALMAEYYAQRADAGLIVTECTAVSEQGKGIINGPGIWRADQIAGWRRVTDAVHAAGGRIYCQLWHCGRVAHPDMRDGELPVAPSPLPARGTFKFPDREADFPVPRALAADEIRAEGIHRLSCAFCPEGERRLEHNRIDLGRRGFRRGARCDSSCWLGWRPATDAEALFV